MWFERKSPLRPEIRHHSLRFWPPKAIFTTCPVFSRVEIREVPSFVDPLRRNMVIQVEEARKYTLSYGGGYASSEGPRGTLGIRNGNFLGRAETLALGLRAGSKRQRANLSYSASRFFGRKLPTVTSLAANNERALTTYTEGDIRAPRGKPFDEFRVIFSTQTERPLSRRESMFFRYNFESVQITLPEDLDIPLQFFREQDRLRAVQLCAVLSERVAGTTRPTPRRASF